MIVLLEAAGRLIEKTNRLGGIGCRGAIENLGEKIRQRSRLGVAGAIERGNTCGKLSAGLPKVGERELGCVVRRIPYLLRTILLRTVLPLQSSEGVGGALALSLLELGEPDEQFGVILK